MKPANKTMQKFLVNATEGLGVGEARRFASEGFQPLVAERIGKRLVSLAHYGEQNGDLMRDPDVVFWLGPDEVYYPISYHNDYLGVDHTYVEFEDGTPARLHVKKQRDLAMFCGTWASNIKAQEYKAVAPRTSEGGT